MSEYSKTLTMIMSHWTKPLESACVDMSSIEFPFNVEEFCRESDARMDTLAAENETLRKLFKEWEDLLGPIPGVKIREMLAENADLKCRLEKE